MNPASDSGSFLLASAPCLSPSSTCRGPRSVVRHDGGDTHPAMHMCISVCMFTYMAQKLSRRNCRIITRPMILLKSLPLRLICPSAEHLEVGYLPSPIDVHQISSGSSKLPDGMTGSQIRAIFPASKFSGSRRGCSLPQHLSTP